MSTPTIAANAYASLARVADPSAGLARAAGETAPLIFTALFSNYWLASRGHVDLMQPTASLAVLIYNFASMPFENQVELAWAAALILVLLVVGCSYHEPGVNPTPIDAMVDAPPDGPLPPHALRRSIIIDGSKVGNVTNFPVWIDLRPPDVPTEAQPDGSLKITGCSLLKAGQAV